MNLASKAFTVLIIFSSFFTKAQSSSDKILTDSTVAIGVILEDSFVGNSVGTLCIKGFDKYIKRNTGVIISGIETCKKGYSDESSLFFEIIYNNETYFIEKERLHTDASYYSQIESMSISRADSFRVHAKQIGQLLYERKVEKLISFLKGCKPQGLAILNWSFYDESEYTEGTSVKINVHNPTSKTIKYLWFTFVGFNPVGDKVIDRRGANITMKGVGPIKPDESGTYEYANVWFTDLVETARISAIKIQYMDGTFKVISKPKEVILPEELYELVSEED